MAEASAATVFTGLQGGNGTGQGEAALLDTAQDFLPYAMQIQAKREAQRIEEATRAREAVKAGEKAWQNLELEMPDVWSVDSPYIEEDLVKYHDYLVDQKMKGVDPSDPYSEVGKASKQTEMQVRKRTSLGRDNEAYFNQNKEVIAKDAAGKYDKAYAAEWFKKYADPKLTPEQRAEMRLNSSPYKLNYSESAFIDDTLPDPTQQGRKKFIDKKAHLANMAATIASPEGQDIYNTLKKEGEDEMQFMERMAEQAQKIHPPDFGVEPKVSQPKQDVVFSYGTGAWGKDLSIQADTLDRPEFAPGINRIAVTKNNGELPKIKATKDDGTLITFEPAEFYMTPTGQISARGLDQDGEEVWINYGKNKSKFVSQLDGFDVEAEFKARNNSGTLPTGDTFNISKKGKAGGTKYVGLDANGDPIFE